MGRFYTVLVDFVDFFAVLVESFTGGFTHGFISVIAVVLHSFHIAYYYNY